MNNPIVIMVGPSGVGKSTLLTRLVAEIPGLHDIVTCTTRSPRAGEVPGVDYHFLSETDFRLGVERGDFLEWAEVHGRLYGTPRFEFEKCWSAALCPILDIDIQGARSILKLFPDTVAVFIEPPSWGELVERLKARGSLTPEQLQIRLSNAERELAEAPQFRWRIVNQDLDQALAELKNIVAPLLKIG